MLLNTLLKAIEDAFEADPACHVVLHVDHHLSVLDALLLGLLKVCNQYLGEVLLILQ